jgi:hypothetical protein
MGIEVQLQGDHGLENEIGGHVAKRVADFLCDWKFLGHRFLYSRRAGLSAELFGCVQDQLSQIGVARRVADAAKSVVSAATA